MNRNLISLILLFAGSALFFVRADRPTLMLPPTGGAQYNLQLRSQSTYVIKFLANRAAMTRVGLYLTTTTKHLPASHVTLSAYREDSTLLGSATLPTSLINEELPSQWQFVGPLKNKAGENVLLQLYIPGELDGLIYLKTRALDGTFKYSDVLLVTRFVPPNTLLPPLEDIVVLTNPEPAAYEVFSQYHPPLAMQIGGLLILAGLALLTPVAVHPLVREAQLVAGAFILSFMATLPAIALGGTPYLLLLTQTAALYGAYRYVRSRGVSKVASFIGAAVFAFTTWFALHLGAGRTLYALAAGLPLIAALLTRVRLTKPRLILALALLAAVAIFSLTALQPIPPIGGTPPKAVATYPEGYPWDNLPPLNASLRDIFVDPNQTQYATKTADPALTWDHFGAYVGIIPVVLALIAIKGGRRWLLALVISAAVITLVPYTAHAAIIPAALVALFAARGTDHLRAFLGEHDRLVHILISAIAVIVLLDLWQVLTPTLEYPFLLL